MNRIQGTKQVVFIEGEEHHVYQTIGTNTYEAFHPDIMGGILDRDAYRKNVLAIEKVTGGKVLLETIEHRGGISEAVVKFDEETDKEN